MTEIKRYLLPDEMEPVSHYCHAIRAGDRVWVSGTVGVGIVRVNWLEPPGEVP